MRYFLEISYRGTNYHGFQFQKNANTIQQEIEKALAILSRNEIKITCSSRTDSGVHAIQNFAHFDFENPLPENLMYKMNCVLPRDICIKNIFPVTNDANARFSAVSRTYKYVISTIKDPFLSGLCYYHPVTLTIQWLNLASQELLSHTDFTSFSKTHSQSKTNICHIKNAEWKKEGNLFVFYIKADRFLWGMVRALAGTMILVGDGTKTVDDFKKIIDGKNRMLAGSSVPAEGLFLCEVEYPKEIFLK
ncbi:MAG: tRNA pseudouridine(38-40) synthase TruA [Bacteroidetes bacterium RIFCSPLOWO2_02_FULL_36_8]|nr:MAG: tRNA pseudouridine(38-40) synthase TruA [Bacteroidetes bacterium RIFCSPLOWO2_02_FULL_36_8]OFY70726.1 MAG: tRNA pseudouridine(38-40) synthase TruA [Bacteroidetes bacterium RIFCSPLOWO2_12_FULL_37_12]